MLQISVKCICPNLQMYLCKTLGANFCEILYCIRKDAIAQIAPQSSQSQVNLPWARFLKGEWRRLVSHLNVFFVNLPAWCITNKSKGKISCNWISISITLFPCVPLCAKLLMVRTMLQSTKTFDTKLVRYIEWSNVQPCVHHISPIWPHYGHFGPKNSHIWPYLAIGSPSCPKLVEHWLNMVEHRSPHLGWATWTPLHPPKWPWGASEGPQNGHF